MKLSCCSAPMDKFIIRYSSYRRKVGECPICCESLFLAEKILSLQRSVTKIFAVTIILMNTFVQLVVNIPAVSGIFDYAVPESLFGKVGVGHLVIAPFGKQTVQGVVFRFVSQPSVPEVKELIELVDTSPVLH